VSAYDAIVIGAGPAGSTTALRLARAGWSVAIVEKAEFPRRKVCGEFISAPTLRLLAELGVAGDVTARAGPEVRELAVYAGPRMAVGPMPPAKPPYRYGRALGREQLDTLLLQAARAAGADVWQPFRVRGWTRRSGRYCCELHSDAAETELEAPILIAAHGSWDTGRLSLPREASDLLGFKAHFTGAVLDPDRMPLVAFPGGYGGLVRSDGGRTSFSCCIRRDALTSSRASMPGASAGAAVLEHAMRTCRGLRESLAGAVREGAWLAAGPLRIGMHPVCGDGFFAVGNALGEAHPVVAEGISMAIQSAWLLSERFVAAKPGAASVVLDATAREYQAEFRAHFEKRMGFASVVAALAMRPAFAGAASGVLENVPRLLGFGARWAGKTRAVHASS
jgi:2-polyprenyl-6-methoxyphenol hydroxylase-like FAD-dependent oxidoreductase